MTQIEERPDVAYLRGKLEGTDEKINQYVSGLDKMHVKMDGLKSDIYKALETTADKILTKMETLASKKEVEVIEARIKTLEDERKKESSWQLVFKTKAGIIKTVLLSIAIFLINIIYQITGDYISKH